MPPVASARPLWWLARWVNRLLTGFAVAAAFTIGAWAMPAHAAPAGPVPTADALAGQLNATVAPAAQLTPAGQFAAGAPAHPSAGPVVPPASSGWKLAAASGSVDAAAPSGVDLGDRADLGGGPGTLPGVPAQPHLPAAGTGAAAVVPAPVAAVPGASTARAPPRA
ncbi:hypothetical protein [Micromonospora craterilacus]|uniref:hypothetical protein n=1 Tax=Micromonospora craterilacus TaxID=1655439 RepID=UPI0011B76036|nr:hypothetical protein [Micromonospora craterilacus]